MLLHYLKVNPPVPSGIATSGVVLTKLRHAADSDYHLTVLREGCPDLDPEVNRVLLDPVRPRPGAILSIDDWGDD